MPLTWREHDRDKFDPRVFLRRLEGLGEAREGKLRFEGIGVLESLEILTFLAEQVGFDAAVPDEHRHRIMNNAAVECATAKNFDQGFFLQKAGHFHNEYLARPVAEYDLFCSVSIMGPESMIAPAAFNGLQFHQRLPGYVDRGPVDHLVAWHFGERQMPDSYLVVQVPTAGRSIAEAGEQAIRKIELLRAVWNYRINYDRGRRLNVSGAPKSVNEILMGPVSTLHRPDGTLAEERFWGDTDYIAPAEPYLAHRLMSEKGVENERWFFERLAVCSFRADIEDALRRYGKALDRTDYDVALLELWSVLELLTDSVGDHKRVVQRAAFVNYDPTYQRHVLNHLRAYRNRLVHAGHSSQSKFVAVHLARFQAERLIMHHLHNELGSATLARASEVLDQPTSREAISAADLNLRAQEEVIEWKKQMLELAERILVRREDK